MILLSCLKKSVVPVLESIVRSRAVFHGLLLICRAVLILAGMFPFGGGGIPWCNVDMGGGGAGACLEG